MLRKVFLSFSPLTRTLQAHRILLPPRPLRPTPLRAYFSQQKGLTAADVPAENLKIKAAQATVGDQVIDFYQTEGGISILDKVPGVKSETGQLYVLSFKCGECGAQSIRSFTKHAYSKGVVLVRCEGCSKIHLVADNLGWFQDEPVNLDTLYQDKVTKVHDHVAIVKFLKTAFQGSPGPKSHKNNAGQDSSKEEASSESREKH